LSLLVAAHAFSEEVPLVWRISFDDCDNCEIARQYNYGFPQHLKRTAQPSPAKANAVLAGVSIVTAGNSPSPVQEQPDDSAASRLTGAASSDRQGDAAADPANLAGQQAFPHLATQVANFFQSTVAFVGDGCGIVDDAQYRQRLEVCRTCDRRQGNRCTACGCWINVKARGRIFRCPIGQW
jgi:hypothetical protein